MHTHEYHPGDVKNGKPKKKLMAFHSTCTFLWNLPCVSPFFDTNL